MTDNISKLARGFESLRCKYYSDEEDSFTHLKEGQNPQYLIVSCCDSRVDPALMFGLDPGDSFSLRVIASLIPPYQSEGKSEYPACASALDYGVNYLKVTDLVVVGHSDCGGIAALTNYDGKNTDDISRWVKSAAGCIENCRGDGEAYQISCQQEAVKNSLNNILDYPGVRGRVAEQKLYLHGLHYHIGTATLSEYNNLDGLFNTVG